VHGALPFPGTRSGCPPCTRLARCFCTPLSSGKARLSFSAGALRAYCPQVSNLKAAINVLQGLPVVLWYSAVYQKVQSSTGSTDIVL